MKRLLLLFLIISSLDLYAQADKEGSLVKWLNLEVALEKVKSQPRPILIDFYTDWCGWCKHMMKTTYADPNLSAYINTYYYPVKFDAEGKDTITYLGETFIPTSDNARTPHPFALKLLQGKLTYPSTLFLNGYDKEKNEFRLSMIASGYLDVPKIEPILIFTLENAFRNSTYDDFKIDYDRAFLKTDIKDSSFNWLTPKMFFNPTSASSKKKIVFINNQEWCNTCKIMKRSSFADSLNTNFLSEKFELIDFDPSIKDSLFYKGQWYFFSSNPQFPYHELAPVLGKGGLAFPSLIILNESNDIIDVISSYVNRRFLNQIIRFYGDDIYQKKSWQEYITGIKPQG